MESNIDEYLEKARSVTQYDLANRFGVRMSVARQILRQKEADGVLVPYIREGGLEVYTTPEELQKRESGAPILIADALEEVASSVPKAAVITEEMDAELIAASGAGSVVKPSRLARKRREAGEKKEKAKAHLPEVIVEPLVPESEEEEEVAPEPEPAPKPKAKPKAKMPAKKKVEKEAKPKKKVTKKKAEEAKPKVKKAVAKKATKKAEAKPKTKVTKKKAEEAPKPKAKKTTKKKAEEAKPKAKKSTAKKATTKKAEAKPKKATAKKTTKKADEKPKKTTKKKTEK